MIKHKAVTLLRWNNRWKRCMQTFPNRVLHCVAWAFKRHSPSQSVLVCAVKAFTEWMDLYWGCRLPFFTLHKSWNPTSVTLAVNKLSKTDFPVAWCEWFMQLVGLARALLESLLWRCYRAGPIRDLLGCSEKLKGPVMFNTGYSLALNSLRCAPTSQDF